jgi:hypothetical protein
MKYIQVPLIGLLSADEVINVHQHTKINPTAKIADLTIDELDELHDCLILPPEKLAHFTMQLQHKPVIVIYELINRV